MSVYTTAQPQLGQQSYGLGQLGQQAPYGQQPFQGQQLGLPQGQMFGQPFGQQMGLPQPYGMPQAGQQGIEGILPLLVTQLALSCAATAVKAVVEQLRIVPEALYGIQAQGQIPAHVYSSVLTECARRVAPVLHTTISPILQGQLGQLGQGSGQPGWSGQGSGQPGWSGQVPGQAWGQPFGQQQPWAGQPPVGLSQLSGAGFWGGFGI